MLHSIHDLTRKVSVMYDKAMVLHRLRYDTPEDKLNQQQIRVLVDDIRALAGDIYNDRSSDTEA